MEQCDFCGCYGGHTPSCARNQYQEPARAVTRYGRIPGHIGSRQRMTSVGCWMIYQMDNDVPMLLSTHSTPEAAIDAWEPGEMRIGYLNTDMPFPEAVEIWEKRKEEEQD